MDELPSRRCADADFVREHRQVIVDKFEFVAEEKERAPVSAASCVFALTRRARGEG
jgi:hypothetical protein